MVWKCIQETQDAIAEGVVALWRRELRYSKGGSEILFFFFFSIIAEWNEHPHMPGDWPSLHTGKLVSIKGQLTHSSLLTLALRPFV